jgi:hypothetical protein
MLWSQMGVVLTLFFYTLSIAFMLQGHRRRMREIWPPPPAAEVTLAPEPEPDPDIAWLFAPDADPAAVARLQEKLKRPLAELVAEAERKAIATHSPLKGDPAEAEVKDCTVSDRRLFAPPEEVVSLIGGGSTYIDVTAFGDRERRYIRTNESGHVCQRHVPAPEPEVLRKLRERRMQVFEQLKRVAEAANLTNRAFTDEEMGQWDCLNEETGVLDRRIKEVLDKRRRT